MGKQKSIRVKWFRVRTHARVPWTSTLKGILSEEFSYVVEIITAGKQTGRAKKDV